MYIAALIVFALLGIAGLVILGIGILVLWDYLQWLRGGEDE